jgi:hypothetical protein
LRSDESEKSEVMCWRCEVTIIEELEDSAKAKRETERGKIEVRVLQGE